MKIRFISLINVLGALGMLACGAAVAQDDYFNITFGGAENYPGASCVATHGTPTFSNGSVSNNSPDEWLNLNCPITHQFPLDSIWVSVWDRNPIGNIRCSVRQAYVPTDRQVEDMPTSWSVGQTSSSSGGNGEILNFVAPVSSNEYEHYYLECAIPPVLNSKPSYIVTYGVRQLDYNFPIPMPGY